MPKFIHILDALAQIGGVCAKKPYYHNADMILFPKRFNNGEKEVHYGLAFEFDNKDAVRVFIDHLVGAVNGGANR